jgi:hypothetical protein
MEDHTMSGLLNRTGVRVLLLLAALLALIMAAGAPACVGCIN